MIARIETALGLYRLGASTEKELQAAVAEVFTLQRIPFVREYDLGPIVGRVDFLVAGSIAVELKISGGFSPVVRQLWRYAEHEKITAVVLVTTRAQHRRIAGAGFTEKPIHVIYVGSAL